MTIDFSKVNVPININVDWLLNKISEETIFTYYFGKEIKLGTAYNSAFDKDRNPSIWFFRNAKGKLLYFDSRSGQKYDCFGFVKKLYNCNFREALEKIAQDFGLLSGEPMKMDKFLYKQSLELENKTKKSSLVQFSAKPWTSEALKFWNQYEITKSELEADNIYLVDKLYINHSQIYNNSSFRFAYLEEWIDDENNLQKGVKIYSPFDKGMKWVSSIPLHVPFGLKDLKPSVDTLWITKSKKDRLILKKFFPDVIATQNESESAMSQKTINFALNNYSKRIINFDADPTGVTNSKKFNEKGFHYFNTPKKDYEKYKIKDVSDYIKAYSLNLLEDLLKEYKLL